MGIDEHKRDIAYCKKWWLPSLILGLGGIVVILASAIFGVPCPQIVLVIGTLDTLNGFYWLFLFLKEIREMEKLDAIARKNGLI